MSELLTHVKMSAADNPEMLTELRIPDTMHVAGGEVGDVKSTAVGLNGHDVEQTAEVLATMQEQGRVVLQTGSGPPVEARTFRLVFTDAKGALGSEVFLKQWLRDYRFLTVEVFDTAGISDTLSKSNNKDLGQLLATWAR